MLLLLLLLMMMMMMTNVDVNADLDGVYKRNILFITIRGSSQIRFCVKSFYFTLLPIIIMHAHHHHHHHRFCFLYYNLETCRWEVNPSQIIMDYYASTPLADSIDS
jgi:hypothetical protein